MKAKRSRRPAVWESPLGCQLWVESDDTEARIRWLIRKARACGLSRLRIFLLWTRIEPQPGKFDFGAYDKVFDVAASLGVGIKATLTANSGPWHLGTAAALHSHTGFLGDAQKPAMSRYIRECVSRYARHPALVQWLLWNEPHGGFAEHTEDNLPGWRAWLRRRYRGDVGRLNARWLTGFQDFAEIPWPEEIPHPFHRGGSWTPYPPRLEEMEWRAARLVSQVGWVASEVRKLDRRTEMGVNPIFPIENKAGGATDLQGLARVVERIGSSYHPVFWHEGLGREEYPGMIGAGVRALCGLLPGKPVELTEVISGNSFVTGSRSCAVGPFEIARFYLGALAAGAATVTGWCLNPRPRDSEAGEFALLDDNEEISGRGRALARLADTLKRMKFTSDEWRPAPSEIVFAVDRRSQAIEGLDSEFSMESPKRAGRGAQDSGRGAWLMAQRAMEAGYSVAFCEPDGSGAFDAAGSRVLVVSHVRAWDPRAAAALLRFVRGGGTLVLDALSGRKDLDAAIYRPWPGGLAGAIGLAVREMETAESDFVLEAEGRTAGSASTLRTHVELGSGWRTLGSLRFQDDKSPAVLERVLSKGRIVYVRFPLGPSLSADRGRDGWFRRLIGDIAETPRAPLRAAPGLRGCVTIPMRSSRSEMVCVLAPERQARAGLPVRLVTAPGSKWFDEWSRQSFCADVLGEFRLPADEGIAILRREAAQPTAKRVRL